MPACAPYAERSSHGSHAQDTKVGGLIEKPSAFRIFRHALCFLPPLRQAHTQHAQFHYHHAGKDQREQSHTAVGHPIQGTGPTARAKAAQDGEADKDGNEMPSQQPNHHPTPTGAGLQRPDQSPTYPRVGDQ